MTIDWKKEAKRLSRTWWGPLHPSEYVLTHPSHGRKAGPGLLYINKDGWLTWNLMLLGWGRYTPPETLHQAQAMVHLLTVAGSLANKEVDGFPLGSYSWFLPPEKFGEWVLTSKVVSIIGPAQAERLSLQCANLVRTKT